MPKTSRFTLEERMGVLELIKPKVELLDALQCDSQVSDGKKEAWELITRDFIKDRPDRQDLTAKEIRELWRRMKHKARMEVRQSIQSARIGNVRTVTEADSMGWLPDNTSHKVIDINDLGLEMDTKFITDFVPLLEEEATVLETRNGVLHDFKEKNSPLKRRASNPPLPNDMRKVVRTDLGATQGIVDDLADVQIVEVLDMNAPGTVKTELTERLHSIPETPMLLSNDDTTCGIQITSVESQQPQYPPDISVPLHFDQRMQTTMNSAMIPKTSSNMLSTMYPNMNSTLSPNMNSRLSQNMNPKMSSNMNPQMSSNANSTMNPKMSSNMNPQMSSNANSTMNPKMSSNANSNMNPKISSNTKMRSNMNSRMSSNMKPRMLRSTMNPTMASKLSSNTNLSMTSQLKTSINTSKVATKDTTSKDLTELSIQFLKQEHEAKMELIRLKQAAAKAKSETARAKRSAYDEKRMFYFEKRKHLHDNGV